MGFNPFQFRSSPFFNLDPSLSRLLAWSLT